jgi:hypothetical protein
MAAPIVLKPLRMLRAFRFSAQLGSLFDPDWRLLKNPLPA